MKKFFIATVSTALVAIATGFTTFQIPDEFGFDGAFLSLWSRDAAANIQLNSTNTFPVIVPPAQLLADELFTWDGWPVRTPTGEVATINGYLVYVALTADRQGPPGVPFYTRSTWRYWYTKNGQWTLGGEVFPREEALGSRQWAGSSTYFPEQNKVVFWYTAVGNIAGDNETPVPEEEIPADSPAAGRPPVTQRIAAVTADVVTDDSSLSFQNLSEHRIILEADGSFYQKRETFNPNQVIYGFRDPFYYVDPKTNEEYILFTANSPQFEDPYDAVIGIAKKAKSQDDGDENAASDVVGQWQLLPPLLAGINVNSQLERPHMVNKDNRYYLFFTTHSFTFAPGLTGPEGLYGFYSAEDAKSLRAYYSPLNGSGLVLGNPAVAPKQGYSYLVLPGGHVMSYLAGFDQTTNQFLATPAPLVDIEIDGTTTMLAAADSRGDAGTPDPGTTPEPGPSPDPEPQPSATPETSPTPSSDAPSASSIEPLSKKHKGAIEILKRAFGTIDKEHP